MAVGNAMVTTAKFKPLSYQEWAAPLKEISSQHTALEDALYQLQDEASNYNRYIAENPDNDTAQRYSAYIDELDRQAAILATQGVTPQNRADLMNLRRQYNTVIKPIKNAVDTYRKLTDEISKKEAQGYIVDKSDLSVPFLLENPDYVPSMINGKELETQVGNLTANLAKTTIPQPTGQYYGNPKNRQEIYIKGVSPEIINKSLINAVEGNITNQYEAELKNYLDGIGFNSLSDENQKRVLGKLQKAMENNSGFGYEIYDNLKYDNIRSQIAHRGYSSSSDSNSSGSSNKKQAPKFTGVISVDNALTESKLVNKPQVTVNSKTGKQTETDHWVREEVAKKDSDVVNKVSAAIPDNAIAISVEDVKAYMPDQYAKLFSNNKVDNHELASKDHLYNFYYVPEISDEVLDATLGRFTGNLNVTVNEKPSGKLYVVPKKVDTKQPNRTYNGELL